MVKQNSKAPLNRLTIVLCEKNVSKILEFIQEKSLVLEEILVLQVCSHSGGTIICLLCEEKLVHGIFEVMVS